MKIMARFKCDDCGIIRERRIEHDIKEIECECGCVMNKMLSAPRCFQNTTGRSPSAK